jgi:hypothetical protein
MTGVIASNKTKTSRLPIFTYRIIYGAAHRCLGASGLDQSTIATFFMLQTPDHCPSDTNTAPLRLQEELPAQPDEGHQLPGGWLRPVVRRLHVLARRPERLRLRIWLREKSKLRDQPGNALISAASRGTLPQIASHFATLK